MKGRALRARGPSVITQNYSARRDYCAGMFSFISCASDAYPGLKAWACARSFSLFLMHEAEYHSAIISFMTGGNCMTVPQLYSLSIRPRGYIYVSMCCRDPSVVSLRLRGKSSFVYLSFRVIHSVVLRHRASRFARLLGSYFSILSRLLQTEGYCAKRNY